MRLIIYKIPDKEKISPNLGKLLEKLATSKKIGVLCDTNILDNFDKELWIFSTNAFLPHDIATGDVETDELQPVLISDKIGLINREVVCVFNNLDLHSVVEFQKTNKECKIADIVYMTKDNFNNCDFTKNDNIKIDMFEKIQDKWNKIGN